MSDSQSGSGNGRGGGDRRDRRPADFQASVNRLERAVDDLVTSARSHVSDRASAFIDDTTDRLEREFGRRDGRRDERGPSGPGDDPLEDPLHELPRRLYRDPRRQKIGGVCAGIARHYGMEPWVVRIMAVTGLLFFPTIVFPAYWIAYFVMDKPPSLDDRRRQRQARHQGRRDRRHRRPAREDHASPAPELGPRFSPRHSLRNIQADLTEVELRLRRMETHVTSGQYELQRELHKIDGGAHGHS